MSLRSFADCPHRLRFYDLRRNSDDLIGQRVDPIHIILKSRIRCQSGVAQGAAAYLERLSQIRRLDPHFFSEVYRNGVQGQCVEGIKKVRDLGQHPRVATVVEQSLDLAQGVVQ